MDESQSSSGGSIQSMDEPSSDVPGHLKVLEERVAMDRDNIREWNNLLTEARQYDVEYARTIYDRFLGIHSTCVSKWIEYIDMEKDASRLEKIFNRCLKQVPSVHLWKRYLDYVRTKSGGFIDREVMIKAYEYSLTQVGLDIHSGQIWRDYVGFIRSEKAETSYEETHMMDRLRKIYQRAVVVPHDQVEVLWREYDSFENGLNKMTAKKILSEKSGAYLTARSFYRELRPLYDQLGNDMVYGPVRTQWQQQQLDVWIRILETEKKNGLKLEEKEYTQRMMFMYRLALCYVPESTNLWLDGFCFVKTREDDGGIDWLKRGTSQCPLDLMLSFALAETYEEMKQNIEAKSVYESILENQLSRREECLGVLGSIQEREQSRFEIQLRSKLEEEVSRLENEHSLGYIQIIRFSRRTEGLMAARYYFGKARKLDFCRSQVFVACAQMEYFVGKDPEVAFKVFELGMKRFSRDPGFVREYMKCLLLHMDDSNARALFERAIQTFSDPDDLHGLYNLAIDYEREYGLLNSLKQFCARKHVQFPEESEMSLLVQRTNFMGLYRTDISQDDEDMWERDRSADQIPKCLVELLENLLSPTEYNGLVIDPDEMCDVLIHVELPNKRARPRHR